MMARGVINRFVSVAAAVATVLAVAIGSAPAAHAAPPKPTSITITGRGMAEKLIVDAAKRSEVFQLLLSEVSWLATATPQASAPKASKLGPKYVLTVYAKNAPQQIYVLYPLASGGPRAYRPAKQPTGKKKDGWFYGRLTRSQSLRVSGVPIKAKTDVINGGIGGGIGEEVTAEEVDPIANINDYLAQIRRLFLLNGAVLVVVLFGLAGVAYLIRRRV
ncbi:MAG TPA: hypothetical protein VFR35_01825 [Actinoplanes sp.]|nr:hypothetical protein [Actinoplanes sp.]